jgi:hypothetical protein
VLLLKPHRQMVGNLQIYGYRALCVHIIQGGILRTVITGTCSRRILIGTSPEISNPNTNSPPVPNETIFYSLTSLSLSSLTFEMGKKSNPIELS